MPGLIFLVIVVVAVIAIYGANASRQRVNAAWADAAQQLGLTVRPATIFGQPQIEGQIDQLHIRIDAFTSSSGNSSRTYTRYRVRYPSRGFDFQLTRQTAFSSIAKLFFAQDIEIGDATFDDAFVVKSDDPDRVAAMLTPMVRTSLLRLIATYPGIEVKDDHIEYSQQHLTKSADRLVTTTRRLVGAAFNIAGLAPATPALDDVVAARRQGDLGEAAKQVRDVVAAHRDELEGRSTDGARARPGDLPPGKRTTPEPEPTSPTRLLEARMLEAETLAEAGDTEEAASKFEALATELPDDPEVQGWQQRLQRHEPPSPPARADTVGADELADELFTGSSLSFETSDRFDAEYKGRPIRWTGAVKTIRDYRYDADLGEGPGTKAVVTVARIDHDLYGEAEIDAVVALPAGSSEGINRRDQITFEGRLAHIDSMMRNIYVEDGRLV